MQENVPSELCIYPPLTRSGIMTCIFYAWCLKSCAYIAVLCACARMLELMLMLGQLRATSLPHVHCHASMLYSVRRYFYNLYVGPARNPRTPCLCL
jgi:hypothetical protein